MGCYGQLIETFRFMSLYENMFMTSFLRKLIHLSWECRAVFINNGWAEIDCEADIAVATDFWSPNK